MAFFSKTKFTRFLIGEASAQLRDLKHQANESSKDLLSRESLASQASHDEDEFLHEIGFRPMRDIIPKEFLMDVGAALKDVTMMDGVFPSIDRTQTVGGSALLRQIVQNPLTCPNILRSRQNALKKIIEVDIDDNERIIKAIRDNETAAIWMFRCRDDQALSMLHDMAFFKSWMFRSLNSSPLALSCLNLNRVFLSPLMGIMSPIVYFVIPYFVIRMKLGLKMSFMQYLRFAYSSARAASKLVVGPLGRASGGGWGSTVAQWVYSASYIFSLLFYFQNIFNSFETSALLRSLCGQLHDRMRGAADFFGAAHELRSRFNDAAGAEKSMDQCVNVWFPSAPNQTVLDDAGWTQLIASFYDPNKNKPIMKVLGKLGWCGGLLTAFKSFDVTSAKAAMRSTYAMDAILSIKSLLISRPSFWTSVTYVHDSKEAGAQLQVKKLRHPQHATIADDMMMIGVSNDWSLTGSDAPGAIVTGPNAGGKSTLLKAIICTVLLGQSLTVAPCEGECRMTPFKNVCSQINVPDTHGVASLFQAEMMRSKKAMEALALSSKAREFTLVVMDELFSSTNPVEGIAGAWAVAKSMLDPDANDRIVVFSTHYTYLCRLEKETKGRYVNYQLPVEVDSQGHVLRYPYTLQKGTCRQTIAIELLQKAGFDPQLVSCALRVKADLLRPITRKKASSKQDDKKSIDQDRTDEREKLCSSGDPGAGPIGTSPSGSSPP